MNAVERTTHPRGRGLVGAGFRAGRGDRSRCLGAPLSETRDRGAARAGAVSAPVLMLQGTGSGVGKSLLTAAFCRLARRRGIAVAPFKGQNMSNNAAVTADGGEIAVKRHLDPGARRA